MLFHIGPFKVGGAREHFAKHAAAIGVDPASLREERRPCGLLAPSHKLAAPTFSAVTRILAPAAVSANRTEGVIPIEGGAHARDEGRQSGIRTSPEFRRSAPSRTTPSCALPSPP
jgi:hypothetical protein